MPKTPNCKLTQVYFSSIMVRRAIKKLRLRTKGAPDDIPPSFINCREELWYPLSQFFLLALKTVYGRDHHTTFKKGITADAINCHRIALTCSIRKLTESIIKDQL
jgi:hypothetical protein